MADVDKESKTEEATPRRLQQMRDEGQIPKSPEVAAVAALAGALAVVAVTAPGIAAEVASLAERTFMLRDVGRPFDAIARSSTLLATALAPILGVAALVAIASTLAQTRLLFNLSLAAPKFDRIDPIRGLERVLPNQATLTELGKSLLKIAVLTLVVYLSVKSSFAHLIVLPATSPEVAAMEVSVMVGKTVLWAVVALGALAALDYYLVHRRFAQDSKMARHEVMQEHKEQEGDPQLKGKRRQKARELSKQRAISDVRNATVLVTNPTHIAVALRYEPERDAAPLMIAEGVDEVALAMRAEARKHGIPIVENRPLARALHAKGKVGKMIPVELYEAAARVIAHVLSLRGPGARRRLGGDA
jgi:flagellar biosynthetic protein FlhB